jgi:hypothetical protein
VNMRANPSRDEAGVFVCFCSFSPITRLAVLSLVLAIASAETLYVVEAVNATAWTWESVSTWQRANGSPGVVPGASDDVVFVRKSCSACKMHQVGWSLTLQSDVTVRSVTFATLGYCLTSFVVGPTGSLRVQSFTAVNGTRVFLQNGSIVAPTLLFDSLSYLGGAGTITGEVVLQGQSTLFAGDAEPCS